MDGGRIGGCACPAPARGQAAWPGSRRAQKLVPFMTLSNGTSNSLHPRLCRTLLPGHATPRKSQVAPPSSHAKGERNEQAWKDHHIQYSPSRMSQEGNYLRHYDGKEVQELRPDASPFAPTTRTASSTEGRASTSKTILGIPFPLIRLDMLIVAPGLNLCRTYPR